MKKLKLHFEFDKNLGKPKYKNFIIKKYNNYSPRQSDIIVVVGGDGFMLQILKKYQKFKKPFYGMNKGTYGFLMNKFDMKNLRKRIEKARPVSVSALQMNSISTLNLFYNLEDKLYVLFLKQYNIHYKVDVPNRPPYFHPQELKLEFQIVLNLPHGEKNFLQY